MDAKSDYAEKLTLDFLLGGAAATAPAGRFVALLTAAPSDSSGGTEVTASGGTTYARQAVTFGAAVTTGGVTTAANSAPVSWTNLPTANITHIAIYSAVTGGNLLYTGALTASKSLTAGDNFTFNTGALTVTEN
jgi:hypothetical protein